MVLSAITILGGAGLLLGLVLAFAGKRLAVKVDPKQEKTSKLLPGANCGVCGFSGCHGMAEALFEGKIDSMACPVADEETTSKIADILGKKIEEKETFVARVLCQGDACIPKYDYDGVKDCRAANLVAGGYKACKYACLGLGSCKDICLFGAIEWEPGKTPVVNKDKCTACGKCIDICPSKVIKLVPKEKKVHIKCSSHLKGPVTRKICKAGCIACQTCVKVCPQQAIYMEDNLAKIDYAKCDNCGLCVQKCPTKTIVEI